MAPMGAKKDRVKRYARAFFTYVLPYNPAFYSVLPPLGAFEEMKHHSECCAGIDFH